MTELQVVDLGNFPVDEATPVVAGPRGPAGADGTDGASAYEVAVANGFVGTEAEWLASLKGADGVGGGGGGAVDSVNGQVGVVVLDAADVGARPDTYVPTWDEVTGKPAIPDSADDIGAETPAGAQAKVDTHAADTTAVHGIADTAALATTADVSAASTADRARANHTGTQTADTLTDGTTNKAFLATERTKLAGVATGATANDTDVNLKNRANHTGSQTSSTISDLTETVQDLVAALVVAGTNVTKTYDDAAGTLTLSASGSGGSSVGSILAFKELTTSAAYATTATTDAELDTTTPANCEITFTVPASGNVMIRQEAYAQWTNTSSVGSFEWTLRDTSGNVVKTATMSNLVTGVLRRVASHVVTGLTPGASVTYRWGHHRLGAATGTTTLYTGGSGGVNGNAQMTVFSMP